MDKVLKYGLVNTALGNMLAAYTDNGLCRLSLPGETEDELARWAAGKFKGYTIKKVHDDKVADAESQLGEYFEGKRRYFSFQLDLRGTAFQRRVWHALLQIPYGKTATYKDIAIAVGSPGAVRAVGQANHRNPIAIVVPCHRIIGSDGSLVGYGGGLDIKKRLLKLEGIETGKER